jgi:hypothetical protein
LSEYNYFTPVIQSISSFKFLEGALNQTVNFTLYDEHPKNQMNNIIFCAGLYPLDVRHTQVRLIQYQNTLRDASVGRSPIRCSGRDQMSDRRQGVQTTSLVSKRRKKELVRMPETQ